MIQYLTTFSTVADYNTFLASEDCPYINVSHITGTNENKYYNNTDGPNQYLTLTVTASNNTVGCQCIVYPAPSSQRGTVYFKLNNDDWTLVFSNSGENWMTLPNLSVNDVLQLKCDNIKNLAYWQFDGNDGSLRIKVSGHFNSLFTSDNFKYFVIPDSYVSDTIFLRGLLGYPDGQTPVVHDAEDLYLPTNLLPPKVFHHLFYNNSIITKVPDINALYLPAGACTGMFENCTALINMPAIAAKTIVAKGTFNNMFKGCTLLANTTPLHIETITSPYDFDGGGAFEGMFCNCESLTSAPSWSISWDYQFYTGKRHVSDNQPYGMFQEAFYNCYNLTTCNWKTWVKMPPENTITGCLDNCFGGCTVLTQAIELSLGDKYEGELNLGSTYSQCGYLTELIFSKVAGPINYGGDGPTSTGTIYVHPDSVYLDPNSEYYGQSPISGWTVESINNYPNS